MIGPRRRWFRRIAAAVVAVAVAIGLWLAVEQYLAGRDWADACAEADRLDPGWRWAELEAARPSLPDDRNLARVVQNSID